MKPAVTVGEIMAAAARRALQPERLAATAAGEGAAHSVLVTAKTADSAAVVVPQANTITPVENPIRSVRVDLVVVTAAAATSPTGAAEAGAQPLARESLSRAERSM